MIDATNPDYYKTRSIECIEFTRNLSFTLGSAFKYVWRMGGKDNEQLEWGKVKWYLHDALDVRPRTLSASESIHLVEDLHSIKSEFEDDNYDILMGIITASAGFYALLEDSVRRNPNLVQ